MDPAAKKRKVDENGVMLAAGCDSSSPSQLTYDDARKIIATLSYEQLADIVASVICRGDGSSGSVLAAVRAIADRDLTQRKLFIRGLGWETTTEGLRSLFSSYGDLEEAVVITDKATGRSKGYGFITFRHIDGAMNALREPSKKIDGRMAVAQLAAAGTAGPTTTAPPATDVSQRKIYVAGVPKEMPSDALLAHFLAYGEIEEGPLGFDKQTGLSRGYALFVYKTAEGARAALVDPVKNVLGHQLTCKLADTGKKGKPSGAPTDLPQHHPQQQIGPGGTAGNMVGNGMGQQFGAPNSYSGYTGAAIPGAAPTAGLAHHHNMNSPLQSSFGINKTPGLGVSGASQVPSSFASYGSASQYGSFPTSGYAGVGGMGMSLYNRMQPNSDGLPSGGGGYAESGRHYSLSSSGYQSQIHHPSGSPPGSRFPAGGVHANVPPYY